MTDEDVYITEDKQPLMHHLLELRTRLLVVVIAFIAASGIVYAFAEPIYAFLVQPLAERAGAEQRRLIYTGLTEAFFTYLKLSFYGGFFLAFPVIASQFYLFLAPGLYKKERIVLLPYLIAAPILFITGAAFCYYMVMPAAWEFFLGFESRGADAGLPIQLEARVSEYLGLVLHLILAFGISFQLPLVLILLVKFGMVQVSTLAKGRRYAVVIIAGASAFITPPDIFSMVALMVPLYMLYEISIHICRFIEKKQPEDESA